MVVSDLNGVISDANAAFCGMLGMSREELIRTTMDKITPSQFHELDKLQLEAVKRKGASDPYEKELIRNDGSRIIVKVSSALINRNDNSLLISNVEDITRKKHDDRLLLEREQQFRSLFENSSIGFYRTTPDGRVLLANPTLIKMLGFESFEKFAQRNLEQEDYEPSYNRKQFKKEIETNGEIKGWEETWFKKDGSELFVRESAHVVTDEKGNVLYYEGTVEDITESKLAQKALKESEEIYRTIFATVSDAIFITDVQSAVIIACNENLSGYKAEELIGKSTTGIGLWASENERNEVLEQLAKNGKVIDFEAHFKRKDGSIFIGSLSANPITIQNKKLVLSVIRDITERKKDEELIRQSEEKFRTAFYVSPDSININRLTDGLYVSINSGFTKITGYTEEEVVGKTSVEINIWADSTDRDKLVAGLLKEGKYENLEARFRMKNGKITYGLMSAAVLKLNGVDHILSITRDITERKRAEQKQWEMQEELHTTLYSIGDAVISTDKKGTIRQMNPVAEQLTGWSIEEARGMELSKVFNIICEDTLEPVENPVNRVLREGMIVGLANHTLLIAKDGTRKPIADSGAPMKDKEGNIIGVVLVFRDQTEERAAHETLRRNEERMRAIVEGTPYLFFYTQDANPFTTYVSPTIKNITGYTPEQWMKQQDWFITDSPVNKLAKQRTREHLKGIFVENATLLEVRHASGDKILLEVFETAVYKDGKIIGLQGVAHDISRRKRAEEELQKTNSTLGTIIESSPLAIIAMDLEGIVNLWNPAAERMFGWMKEEVAGKFLPTISENMVDEYTGLRKRILNSPIMNYEIKRKKKDGSLVDVSVSAVLLKNENEEPIGILSLYADITSRKRYEENLKKLYQATEQSPVSIVITDVKGNIEYVNPHLTRVSGYTFNEVIGKNPKIFQSGNKTKDEYNDLWKTILSGEQWRGEFQNKRKDGTIYWESASISAIRNDAGEITHFIAVKEDITDRKLILEELIVAKNKAEEANRTKDVFLANMSHELRTPLIGILGYSDLLTETVKEEESLEMARGIKRSGKRLLNTLNMILNFTKIEADKYDLILKPTDIREELEAVYKMFNGAAIEKGLKFNFSIPDEELIINIDAGFLSVILENLVNNAIKFTSKGSIKLSAGKEDTGKVFIKVKDTGIGIQEHNLEAIFQEFKQVSEGINREFQGTGLGLSIAKKYAEVMNGEIKVNSEFGKGTEFILYFKAIK